MDDEIKQLAVLALANALYDEYSKLVTKYLKAAEGLAGPDVEVEDRFNVITSYYSANHKAEDPGSVLIRTDKGILAPQFHETLAAALQSNADEISVNGRATFERRSGEWYYVGS